MQITPEVKAQLEEQKKNCIFCKILKGEMDSQKIYEDKLMFGILDINPAVKGHILLMPKEHYPIIPYLPPETFRHIFGLMPRFIKAVKKAMVTTGANIMIANGGAAGQQSPHFLFHIIPRDKGDSIFNYEFNKKGAVDDQQLNQANQMLSKNLKIMIGNHIKRDPISWKINMQTQHAYEDDILICKPSETPKVAGHLVITLKKPFEELNKKEAAHVFYVASYSATAVFEGLGAHGTNIIAKIGQSDDNLDGKFSMHILPRYQDDGLDVNLKPSGNKPDKGVASRIKDATFEISYEQKENKQTKVVNLDKGPEKLTKEKKSNTGNEIQDAIDKIRLS
ncbi:MAG: hypothetical protein MAG795_00774 [Candidatus Woesearchaeota archaeon]|nr:hypothetical protein [Candidatus Woesearchaeota archaeon]